METVYLHGVYVTNTDYSSSCIVANLKNNTTGESTLKCIRDPIVPFWVTKKDWQVHKCKREFAPDDELKYYQAPAHNLNRSLAKALGWTSGKNYPLKVLCNSPYVYGADITPEVIYNIEQGSGVTNVRTGCLDIEQSLLGNNEIILNTYVDPEGKIYTAVYTPFLTDMTQEQCESYVREETERYLNEHLAPEYRAFLPTPLDIVFKFTDDEAEVIAWPIEQVNRTKADFVGIWNIDYDLPTILERLAFRGVDPATVFPHPDVPMEWRQCKYYEDTKPKQHLTDAWHWFACTGYTQYIDTMCLYARLRKAEGKDVKNTLEYIANKEIGCGKLEFPDGMTHITMQESKFPLYTAYNIIDTVVTYIIEKRNQDIRSMCNLTGYSRLRDYAHQTVMIKNEFYRYCRQHHKVPASVGKDMVTDHDELIVNVGGGVLSPSNAHGTGVPVLEESNEETRLHRYVADLDVTSAYPNSVVVFNISKETKISTCVGIEGLPNTDIELFFTLATAADENAIELGGFFNLPGYNEMLELYARHDIPSP